MEALTVGPILTLVQNTGYAMPGINTCKVRANGAIESSMDNSTYVAVTLTNNEAEISAPFIRSTGVGTLVRLTRL